jgi:hypothetical protein
MSEKNKAIARRIFEEICDGPSSNPLTGEVKSEH